MCLCDNILKTKRKRVKNIHTTNSFHFFFSRFLKKKRSAALFSKPRDTKKKV